MRSSLKPGLSVSTSIIDKMALKASDVQKKFHELVTTINVGKSYR